MYLGKVGLGGGLSGGLDDGLGVGLDGGHDVGLCVSRDSCLNGLCWLLWS